MSDNFNYSAVPTGYIHCFNESCARGEECLRRLTARHAPASTPHVVCLNPAAYPKDAARCTHFRSARKLHYAWGIQSLCDEIPYKTALAVKACLHCLFPKTTYYRILHQERALSPAEQAEIARIFVQNQVSAPPRYDRYTDDYDFSNN